MIHRTPWNKPRGADHDATALINLYPTATSLFVSCRSLTWLPTDKRNQLISTLAPCVKDGHGLRRWETTNVVLFVAKHTRHPCRLYLHLRTPMHSERTITDIRGACRYCAQAASNPLRYHFIASDKGRIGAVSVTMCSNAKSTLTGTFGVDKLSATSLQASQPCQPRTQQNASVRQYSLNRPRLLSTAGRRGR